LLDILLQNRLDSFPLHFCQRPSCGSNVLSIFDCLQDGQVLHLHHCSIGITATETRGRIILSGNSGLLAEWRDCGFRKWLLDSVGVATERRDVQRTFGLFQN